MIAQNLKDGDVLLVNRYYAWYTNTGQTDIIPASLERDMLTWRRAFRKLVMMSEYGCDAVAGASGCCDDACCWSGSATLRRKGREKKKPGGGKSRRTKRDGRKSK